MLEVLGLGVVFIWGVIGNTEYIISTNPFEKVFFYCIFNITILKKKLILKKMVAKCWFLVPAVSSLASEPGHLKTEVALARQRLALLKHELGTQRRQVQHRQHGISSLARWAFFNYWLFIG